jgi:hypothetical protein
MAARRLVVTTVAASLVLLALVVAPAVGKGPGPSTPNVSVTAYDPGTTSGLQIELAAGADAAAHPYASLSFRIAGLSLDDFTVHRVAAGDTSCGGGEDEAADSGPGTLAAVRGVGTLATGREDLGLPAGSTVQVWLDLRDAATGVDQARVRVRPHQAGGGDMGEEESCGGGGDEGSGSCEEGDDEGDSCGGSGGEGGTGGGGMGPWLYDSDWLTIEQVTIRFGTAAEQRPENGIFLCYSTYQVTPGVWPEGQAKALVDDGYWLPYAVAGTDPGGTTLGAFHLVCNPAQTQSVGGTFVGGDGSVLGPVYRGTFGVYPVAGA